MWVQEFRVVMDAAPSQISQSWADWLRAVRRRVPGLVVWVSLAFTLYCTGPTTVVRSRSGGTKEVVRGSADRPFEEEGESSWYGGNGDGFAGKPTASGEIFDPGALTCAHRTLPLGSSIEVENLSNGKRLILRVNDRGPFARGRVLDVSQRAAKDLGFLGQGIARIRLRTVDLNGQPAPLDQDLDQRDPYTIQVAALSDPANIDRLTRELEEAFGPVTLQEAITVNGHSVKRVRAGSYTRLSEAQQAAERIQKRFRDRGIDPFITRRR